VAHEEGDLNDLRAILSNDVAIKAYREGKLPFPDGTIIARLAWSYVPLEESSTAFGRLQSFVAGPPKNGVQFMVKDSKKYAPTGGWGFAQFNDGKPADEAVHNTCFSCHEAVKARDFVFARYAPLILTTTVERNETMTTQINRSMNKKIQNHKKGGHYDRHQCYTTRQQARS
jgi:hypothetical protein